MDEPSEGLAPLLVRELGRILGRLKAGGASILIIVEQNLASALRADLQADRGAIRRHPVADPGAATTTRGWAGFAYGVLRPSSRDAHPPATPGLASWRCRRAGGRRQAGVIRARS
jgi:hypothetical protein